MRESSVLEFKELPRGIFMMIVRDTILIIDKNRKVKLRKNDKLRKLINENKKELFCIERKLSKKESYLHFGLEYKILNYVV